MTIKNKLEKILGFPLEETGNMEFGDYTSNVAMASFAKSEVRNPKFETKFNITNSKYKNPKELAEEIVKKLAVDSSLSSVVGRVEVAGPGFINFFLKKDVLVDNLIQIALEKEKYGTSDSNKGKLAIVEYSSPNIAKPFTIGHLRSTIIGDAIANLLQKVGYKVMRDNHLGDWGTQFGKMIYAIKEWGDEKEISKSENPVKELVALYVKFHEEAEKYESLEEKARVWFKKLEDGDSEARRIWQKCIDWSFVEFDRIYKILGVSFNKEFEDGHGLGESFFESRMKAVIEELVDKKLLKEGKEGAKLVFFKSDKYPPAMILKKDGATLYHTRDLATDKYRLEKYNPDLIINEVGMEQTLYFQQLFEIEKLLGWFNEGARVHIGHGLIRFKEGKMSTRRGNVIWMEEVLEEAEKRALDLATSRHSFKLGEEVSGNEVNISISRKSNPGHTLSTHEMVVISKEVAIGALKYNDLKRDPSTNIIFDWDEILNMEGNSGPYLQYTVARCNSVIQKASSFKGQALQGQSEVSNQKFQNEELEIMRILVRFSDTIADAAKNYSPNLLCNYLYDLAQKYNGFYNKYRILKSESGNVQGETLYISQETADFRLALTNGVGQVLKNGLRLLGIESPEKM